MKPAQKIVKQKVFGSYPRPVPDWAHFARDSADKRFSSPVQRAILDRQ